LVERGYKIVRATQYPRHFPDIDPTITLLAPSMTNAHSYFMVYAEDRLVFSESTRLEPVDLATSNVDGILYKTSLVPGFWDTISQSSDASQYTIIQHVVEDVPSSSSKSSKIFSAMFKFLYQTSTPTEDNFSISHMLTTEALEQNNDFDLETLLSMDADAYSDMMDLVKSPSFFDMPMDFTLSPADWSLQCSPDQSGYSSPIHYPQSISSIVSDEDDQLLLLSPVSSFGIDMPHFQ